MFFRNLVFFHFPPLHDGLFQTRLQDDFDNLHGALDECRLRPVGPLELSSRGFISPLGRDAEELAHRIGATCWITIGGEDRLLPASVVNDLLAKKLEEIERTEGRQPGGRTRKRIKDELIVDLLPRALISPSRVDAYFDFDRNFIAVDTASRRTAENVIAEVRRAAGSFPALPLNAEVAPRSILTGWLSGEPLPDGMRLGDECELRDPGDRGGVVKVTRDELQSDEVAKHLEAGKQCTRLALTLHDHVSFVFGEDLVVRKLKFLDGAVDVLENTQREDLRAELDARFALMSGEVGRLYDVLAAAFKLTGDSPDLQLSKRPRRTSLHGIGSVTISIPGSDMAPVTLTAAAFANLGTSIEQYNAAVAIVRESGRASVSHLQRKLGIGYNRAAGLIEAMASQGVVSQPDHHGDRSVVAATAHTE